MREYFAVYRGRFWSGDVLRTESSGCRTVDAKKPTLDFAVPYAAPKLLKTMAATQPMALKKGLVIQRQ